MIENIQTEIDVKYFLEKVNLIRIQLKTIIVGQEDLINDLLITLLSGGNALLEGVPGLGKTLLVRTLSETVQCSFSRVQFTPDLMPADITGTMIISETADGRRGFRFEAGPIFANLVLADEINRASPRTQSALLEAMQEHNVTVAGQTRALPEPFFVLATQNPLEMEGTYPLPEAQLDRFFYKINVPYPSEKELVEIARRTTGAEVAKPDISADGRGIIALQKFVREVPISEEVLRYAARLIEATHPNQNIAPEGIKHHVRIGASPRGMQTLIIAGKVKALLDDRKAVGIDDLRKVAYPALRHRMILKFEAQADGIPPDSLLDEIIQKVPVR